MSERSYMTKASPRRWTAGALYPPAGVVGGAYGYVEEFEVEADTELEAMAEARRQAKDELIDGWTEVRVRPYVSELIVMHW